MRSSYHQVDDVVVLTIAGAIDTHAAAVEFEYLLAHVPGAGHLVLDLAEVTALGTTGLTVLARGTRRRACRHRRAARRRAARGWSPRACWPVYGCSTAWSTPSLRSGRHRAGP